jgi:hypothetical protein
VGLGQQLRLLDDMRAGVLVLGLAEKRLSWGTSRKELAAGNSAHGVAPRTGRRPSEAARHESLLPASQTRLLPTCYRFGARCYRFATKRPAKARKDRRNGRRLSPNTNQSGRTVQIGFVMRFSRLLRSPCGPKSRAVPHTFELRSPNPLHDQQRSSRKAWGTPKGRDISEERVCLD